VAKRSSECGEAACYASIESSCCRTVGVDLGDEARELGHLVRGDAGDVLERHAPEKERAERARIDRR
jgi:hypothetical protein